jgi:hypothetical protein
MILVDPPENGSELLADLHFIPAAMVTSHDSEAIFLYVTAATLSSMPFCANHLHTKLFNIHSLSSC